jgi:hypothetical protein
MSFYAFYVIPVKPAVGNNTVKPVYNGHPWNLKNVAVMQRIV